LVHALERLLPSKKTFANSICSRVNMVVTSWSCEHSFSFSRFE